MSEYLLTLIHLRDKADVKSMGASNTMEYKLFGKLPARSLIAIAVGYFAFLIMYVISALILLAAARSELDDHISSIIFIGITLATMLISFTLPAIMIGMIARKMGRLHGLVFSLPMVMILLWGTENAAWWLGPMILMACSLGGAFGSFLINIIRPN